MVTLKKIKAVNNLADLEALGIGKVYYDVGDRGGGAGFWAKDICGHFNVDAASLPPKFGAGCNYLGGGIRGSVFPSGFSRVAITGRKATILTALAAACVRVYKSIEDENGMNDACDDEGDTNWDALATKGARKAGIVSAY